MDDTKKESMGSRICMLREARGMTQTDLAEELGVTKAAVSAWETGYAENIRLQTFLKLCDVLGGVTPQYLVNGVGAARKGRPLREKD